MNPSAALLCTKGVTGDKDECARSRGDVGFLQLREEQRIITCSIMENVQKGDKGIYGVACDVGLR